MSARGLSFAPQTARMRAAWRSAAERAGRAWRTRSPREQGLLAVGGGVAALAVVWIAFVDPALASLARTGREIPRLHAQRAELDATINDALALGRGTQTALSDEARGAALTESLAAAGLAALAQVTQADAGRWQVTLRDAPAAAAMQWLADVLALTRLRPETLDLSRAVDAGGQPRPGRVVGTIRLYDPADAVGGAR